MPLQRGRAHVSAEIENLKVGDMPGIEASTGPRSRERGDNVSMKPTEPTDMRFNGAALT